MQLDHRQLPSTAAGDPAARATTDGSTSRRSLLGRAVGPLAAAGAAAVPIVRSAASAGAAELDQFEQIAWFQTIELAAVAVYEAAAGKLAGAQATVAADYADHHRQHAKAMADILAQTDVPAPGAANAKLQDEYSGRVAGGGNGALAALQALEEALAATYVKALGTIENKAAAATIATILPVDAEHAAVLASAQGKQGADVLVAVQTDAGALDPTAYPPPVETESQSPSGATPGGGATGSAGSGGSGGTSDTGGAGAGNGSGTGSGATS